MDTIIPNSEIFSSEERVNPFKDKRKKIGLIWNDNIQWRLKYDVKRVLLYETIEDGIVISKTSMLTPNEAIILALFDESLEKADKTIDAILGKWSMALEEKNADSVTPQYDPKRFVIPTWNVDNVTKRLFIPISIQFRVSDSCMRKCGYCNIQTRPHNEMNLIPLERWDQLAQEVKEMDISSILLSGGDPFMHKDIVEIIRCFTGRELNPFVSTKSLISKETARKLREVGLKQMQVSIDAPVADVCDYLTQSPGYFDQVVQTIKNLQEVGIVISTNTVVTSYNILLIPNLIRMLYDMGIRRIKMSQYARTLYNEHDDSFFLDKKAIDWITIRLEKLRSEFSDAKVSFGYVPDYATSNDIEMKKQKFAERAICTGCIWSCVVSGDGRVIPCDEIPLTEENVVGDVRTQSIREVWNSPKIERFASPSREFFGNTMCSKCEDFDECHQGRGRCFRDSLKAYGSLFAPAPLCWKSPKGTRIC